MTAKRDSRLEDAIALNCGWPLRRYQLLYDKRGRFPQRARAEAEQVAFREVEQ